MYRYVGLLRQKLLDILIEKTMLIIVHYHLLNIVAYQNIYSSIFFNLMKENISINVPKITPPNKLLLIWLDDFNTDR